MNDPCHIPSALMSVDDALSLLLSKALPVAEIEHVEIASALGRVLAQPQTSALDIPPAATSAMDGYAIAHRDLHAGEETYLHVSQRIPAGSTGRPLEPHTAARIFYRRPAAGRRGYGAHAGALPRGGR